MAIDTTAPRSRRALLFGALGGAIATVAAVARPATTRAGVDGDVVLDDTNTAAGTTEIDGGSATVFKVVGSGIGIEATGSTGPGVVGYGPDAIPTLTNFPIGLYGSASGAGVLGQTEDGMGVFGHSDNLDGVYGQASGGNHPTHTPSVGVHGVASAVGVVGSAGTGLLTQLPDPIDAHTGVYGISDTGHGIYGASDTGIGIYAANNSATKGAIVAEGGPGTAIHGHANAGPVPASPGLTGMYGSATGAGVAIAADSASGLALRATSSASHGIKGRGQIDGVIGESPGARSGVVGYSGGGSAPAGPAKTGVYGEATQDTASRGVSGFALAGQGVRGEATTGQGVQGIATTGQAVRGDTTGGTGVHGQATSGKGVRGVANGGDGVAGEATSGVGVRAVATTGVALAVSGRATFSRSGKVTVPVGVTFIDVTVAGGLTTTAIAFATLQYLRSGVYVMGARPNHPSAGKLRIYLSKALATATPVAWFVIG